MGKEAKRNSPFVRFSPVTAMEDRAVPAGNLLGQAAEFNAVFFHGMHAWYSDVEGRLAVGGNASLTGYSVGVKTDSPGAELIVGGDLTYSNGQVDGGDVLYAGDLETYWFGTNGGEIVADASALDFSALAAQMQSTSADLKNLPVTGETKNIWGSIQFVGTRTDINVFEVQASELGNAWGITINAPAGSSAIINVVGDTAELTYMGFDLTGGIRAENVLLNFPDAHYLKLEGIGVQGSILAPKAFLEFNNGQVNGNVIACQMCGNGQFNWLPNQTDIDMPEEQTDPADEGQGPDDIYQPQLPPDNESPAEPAPDYPVTDEPNDPGIDIILPDQPNPDVETPEETGTASISGYVFADADSDGLWDEDENGVPRLVSLVALRKDGNIVMETVMADPTGYFTFTGLLAGVYMVAPDVDTTGFGDLPMIDPEPVALSAMSIQTTAELSTEDKTLSDGTILYGVDQPEAKVALPGETIAAEPAIDVAEVVLTTEEETTSVDETTPVDDPATPGDDEFVYTITGDDGSTDGSEETVIDDTFLPDDNAIVDGPIPIWENETTGLDEDILENFPNFVAMIQLEDGQQYQINLPVDAETDDQKLEEGATGSDTPAVIEASEVPPADTEVTVVEQIPSNDPSQATATIPTGDEKPMDHSHGETFEAPATPSMLRRSIRFGS